MSAPRAATPVPQARKILRTHGLPLLVHALNLFDQSAPAERALADQLWTTVGAGVALAGILREDQKLSGRAVQEALFALHNLIIPGTAHRESASPLRERLEPYTRWLEESAYDRAAPWRALFLRWIDVFSERLTMHRYPDRQRRRIHARALLVEPLFYMVSQSAQSTLAKHGDEILIPRERPQSAAPAETLILFCEQALAFWDLRHAEAQAHYGWNRIALPVDVQLGGFFGLGDEARPPDAEAILQAAEALAHELAALSASPQVALPPDVLTSWLQRLRGEILSALQLYTQTGSWPA